MKPTHRDFYVITYDIPEDRLRERVARWLERYGERVQYSVFEVYLTPQEWKRVRSQLAEWIATSEGGSIRVYRLCRACRQQVEVMGEGEVTAAPRRILVV